jgi:hypothetical protein
VKRLLVFVLDTRLEKLTRQMVRHGAACPCGLGVAFHCPRWAAISGMYDDALTRRSELTK